MAAHNFLTSLTNLGDLAVLLPVAIVVLVWLAFMHTREPALWWVIALAFCVGGTGLLKIIFSVCPPVPGLQSPSSHTSLSTLVYGGLATFLAVRSGSWQRLVVIAAGGALVGSIALSRVMLNSHTLLETGFGIAIGGLALLLFARGYLRHREPQTPLRPLLLTVAVLLVLLHGQQLHAEDLVRVIGGYLRTGGLACG